MATDKHWCFAWFVPRPANQGRDKATLLRRAKWTSGQTITVSFLDGDPAIQDKVKAVASQWVGPTMANLRLNFRKDTTNTLVRISFKYEGSWSTIGTECKQVTNKAEPTMNYGWLDANSTDDEIRRVVLHEFGHALGLIHEHQNPTGGIEWDREAVIKDLYPRWDMETIERNMFAPYSEKDTNFTNTDRELIMMYPIPPTWTKNGFTVGLNTTLSNTDMKFIRQQYP